MISTIEISIGWGNDRMCPPSLDREEKRFCLSEEGFFKIISIPITV
jgi:hypothetical protein